MQAAGAKFTKGFPASMQGGPPKPPATAIGRGAPITASFAQQFAAHNPQTTMPALKAVTSSMRNDSQRLAIRASSPAAPARGNNVIQKQVLRAGDGASVAKGDVVSVSYIGWLANSSPEHAFDQGRDFRFGVGQGDVIPGWDEVVCGMREGEVAKVLIPSQLAYGARGAPPKIPPHADLMFEILVGGVLTSNMPPTSASAPENPPPAVSATPTSADDPSAGFISAARFAGPKAGMSFKNGPHGLGYYSDELAPRGDPPGPRASVKFEPAATAAKPKAEVAAPPRTYASTPVVQPMAAQRPSAPSYSASATPVLAAQYAATHSFAGQGAFTRRSFSYM